MNIISFENAQFLKEKGFNIPINTFYLTCDEVIKNRVVAAVTRINWNQSHDLISAPSYDDVIDWLLETYNIRINIKYTKKIRYYFNIITPKTLNYDEKCDFLIKSINLFNTHHDAEMAAVEYALDHLLK